MLNSLKRSKNFAGGDSLDALAQSEAEWLRANNDDIVRTLCNKELLERVLGIIEELPDKRREVFRLSFCTTCRTPRSPNCSGCRAVRSKGIFTWH